MKSLYLALFLSLAAGGAEPVNLLREPLTIGNVASTVRHDGGYRIDHGETVAESLLEQTVELNQQEAKPISFGVEATVTNTAPPPNGPICRIDLTYQDGTRDNWISIPLTARRAARTYHPKKPVRSVRYILLLRKSAGQVIFRNPILCEGDVKLAPPPAPAPPAPVSKVACENLGVGARGAELRSLTAFRDATGKRRVIIRPQDSGRRSYLLLIDIESGKTEQIFLPDGVVQGDSFGSILTSKQRYFHDRQGGRVFAFDPAARTVRDLGRPEAETQHFMTYAESPDGMVYLGGYPQASLVRLDPATMKFTSFGRMDPAEKYIRSLATDRENWVYCGIGTARGNLVALNPATGEKRALLPEKYRKSGTARVISGDDGFAYGSFNGYTARFLGGRVVAEGVAIPKSKPEKSADFGARLRDFGDGSLVAECDLATGKLTICEADGQLRTLPLEFTAAGVDFTGIGPGPGGKVYASTAHPMRFVEFDGTRVREIGSPMGCGNFCAIATAGEKIYAAGYPEGALRVFDPARPFFQQYGREPRFGIHPAVLQTKIEAPEGVCAGLSSLLYCRGKRPGATFVLPLQAAAPGSYYLNLSFLRHPEYGSVTVEFAGTKRTLDLHHPEALQTDVLTFGPVELPTGRGEVRFTVNPGKSLAFGISGVELAAAPRKLPPVDPAADNPRIIGHWPDLVTRPRALLIHPDGPSAVMSGFANYGQTGGGFGISNLATGETRAIAEWLPGQSCIAMALLPGGDLVGGTSIDAPGGGRIKAKNAAVFRLGWPEGKVRRQLELPGVTNVVAVEFWNGRIIAVSRCGKLFVIHPDHFRLEKTVDLAPHGTPVRRGLLKTDDDRLFLLQSRAVSELRIHDFTPELLSIPPQPITAGGAISNGHLVFGCGAEFVRCPIPPVTPGGQNRQAFRVDTKTSYEEILDQVRQNTRRARKYRWEDYLALLDELQKSDRYLVLPGREFLTTEDPSKIVVYMRHDIDVDPITALKMSAEEKKRGIRASYYILPTAPYYGRQTTTGVERYAAMDRLYRQLQNDGHELGVHNDLLSMMLLWDIDPVHFQQQELAYYHRNGFTITGVVSHGSSVVLQRGLNNTWIFAEFNRRGEYVFNGKKYHYGNHPLTDFGFRYEGYRLKANQRESDISGYPTGKVIVDQLRSFRPGERVSLLTHPIHWGN